MTEQKIRQTSKVALQCTSEAHCLNRFGWTVFQVSAHVPILMHRLPFLNCSIPIIYAVTITLLTCRYMYIHVCLIITLVQPTGVNGSVVNVTRAGDGGNGSIISLSLPVS